MAVKVCCIQNCKSCSTRPEDIGVTYHKFPRDVSLCDTWIKATHHSLTRTDTPVYVCSRHFCKNDFQIYQDSKYVLKSDAVPSIFPWVSKEVGSPNSNMESEDKATKDATAPGKEVEGENLEAIKKFIEDQEKEFLKQDGKEDETSGEAEKKPVDESKDFDERLAVASSMMDMILSESEERITNKNNKFSAKPSFNNGDKGNNSMALSVGSKVEAKDFSELWYPAQIAEVDYEEMEVLVHYDNPSKKHDEWISVSSPRLRPITASTASSPVPTAAEPSGPSVSTPAVPVEETKLEEKQKLVFVVGERCLARWRDNRRFMATVTKDLGDGQYEVIFDDGFKWKCATSRLHKLKDPSKTDQLSVDTSSPTSSTSAQSPVLYGTGPSNSQPLPLTPTPAYHTHLFDPTRDYLGSKSERREMKRKLNIKEIFNIGQKKKKQLLPKEKVAMPRASVERKPKPRIIRRKTVQPVVPKKEIPDAVASIIGTREDAKVIEPKKEAKEEITIKTDTKDEGPTEGLNKKVEGEETMDVDNVKDENEEETKTDVKDETLQESSDTSIGGDSRTDSDPVQEEEVKLEKFEQQDGVKHEEVIDRMKEVINKLEDGISKAVNSPKPQPKEEIKIEVKEELTTPEEIKKKDRKLSKIKKGKKLRLLQEKKVKKQVEKVKSELEVMKKQFEEMRQQMLAQTEELAKGQKEMPESYLLPGEWCCKWVNGQPVGTVSELEGEVRDVNSKPGLPRRSVQVEDKRLPPGWTKHMVRRSLGHSAGKWDVVLVSPDNRRFHTRTDMRGYMAASADDTIREYEHALMDFGIHLKLSRRMGWVSFTPGGVDDTPVVPLTAGTLGCTSPLVKRRKLQLKRQRKEKKQADGVDGTPAVPLPAGTLTSTLPLVKRRKLTLKRDQKKEKKDKKKRKLGITIKMPKYLVKGSTVEKIDGFESTSLDTFEPADSTLDAPPLEDGYVWVGSLKVQIIENLLRCPAEGCFKNFRNNTLLQMHIKHYHRDLRKMLGRTPKVLDLAYARTMPTGKEPPRAREPDLKTIKVKIPRPPKRIEEPKLEVIRDEKPELSVDLPLSPVKLEAEPSPKMQDSPKLRNALVTKKRPRVLLPVRKPDPDQDTFEPDSDADVTSDAVPEYPMESLDFEKAISTHTVTRPVGLKKERKRVATLPPRVVSEDDDWLGVTSDVETRSSFPRSGTPDSKAEQKVMPVSSESNEEQKNPNYMYTETGERIKIVHMKREEIINCHCGFREEDGLMVQCELCLCWQHAMCHNIQRESEVPEKYTCSICLNPRRGRRSQRFLHDQDRLYEGLLPGARPCEQLRRAHELSGNLLRVRDALHALRVKYYVATKKDHPKLYLWAKDWENGELTLTQEKLNSDYSDLNIMVSGINKENLPMKQEEKDLKEPQIDVQTPPSEEHDRYNQRDPQLNSSLLSGLLSSPGASLDLPISTSEIERLAKTVQEEARMARVPQPEAPIEDGACRERLLRHLQRAQQALDARLDSIEAQVAELESQDPSFEDDETADYFPRTKQTIQMLMRDLDTMEELGVIT